MTVVVLLLMSVSSNAVGCGDSGDVAPQPTRSFKPAVDLPYFVQQRHPAIAALDSVLSG
jgi:hypothetical protein